MSKDSYSNFNRYFISVKLRRDEGNPVGAEQEAAQFAVSCIGAIGFFISNVSERELDLIPTCDIATNLNLIGVLISGLADSALGSIEQTAVEIDRQMKSK